MKQTKEHSVGGIVYRKVQIVQLVPAKSQNIQAGGQKSKKGGEQQQIQWLISKHSGYHKWVLPKGIVEERETGEEAALREVEEETGIKAEIVEKIDFEVRYQYQKDNILVDKTVEFYLMKYVGGDTKNHSWEMEEVKWAEYDEATKLLGFEGEKEVLKRVIKLI